MSEVNLADLGQSAIEVAGLRLWVHGRQFPECDDYWDGNWLSVTALCCSDGAKVETSGSFIHLSEVNDWLSALITFEYSLSGTAELKCIEPELSVLIQAQVANEITMSVIITPDHITQPHSFIFNISNEDIAALIVQCRKIINDSPLKGRSN